MANTAISNFPPRTVLDGAEEMVVAHSGLNYKYDIGQILRFTNAEYTAAGVLVYPWFVSPQTPVYSGSKITGTSCLFNGKTYAMTMTYGTSGLTKDKLISRAATDTFTVWSQTITYNGTTGQLENVSDWA